MSNLRFNIGPNNFQVSDHIFHDSTNNRLYKILYPIGHWDDDKITVVYKGTFVHPKERARLLNPSGALVSIKLCNKILEPYYYDLARKDAHRSDIVRHKNILPVIGSFDDANDENIYCLVMFESQTIDLRALMFSSEVFKSSGLPEDCIAIALNSAVEGIAHIHNHGELHRRITASNIVYFKPRDCIKITFAASAYVRTDGVPNPDVASTSHQVESLLYRDILKWGRAPEVLEPDEVKYKAASKYTVKSDIWLIGITALEFAYGGIRISDRQELLDIARCISVTQKMATTWEDQIRQSQEFKLGESKTESPKPPKGKQHRIEEFSTKRIAKIWNRNSGKLVGNKVPFSKGFVKLVAKCLSHDPERRPTTGKLLKCKFLKKAKSVQYFKDAVVIKSPLS